MKESLDPVQVLTLHVPDVGDSALTQAAKIGPVLPPQPFPRERLSAVHDSESVASQKAAPLVRVEAKFTVQNAVCESLRRRHTVFLTVNLTMTRTSGAALTTCVWPG